MCVWGGGRGRVVVSLSLRRSGALGCCCVRLAAVPVLFGILQYVMELGPQQIEQHGEVLRLGQQYL